MRSSAWAAPSVVAVLVLAGCAGPKAAILGSDGGLAVVCVAEDLADESTGGILGFVVDDELQKLAGARVQLRELKNETITGEDGSFCFGKLPPSRYTIDVAKLGFHSRSVFAGVEAGLVSRPNIEVRPLPYTVYVPTIPRKEILGPFQGYVQCRMSTPFSSGACGFVPVVGNTPVTGLWTNDKVAFDFKLTGPDWSQIVFEAKWRPSSFATNPQMTQVFSYTNRSSTHWFADSGAQHSPILFNYTKGKRGPGGQLPGGVQPNEPNLNITLRTWLTLPFADVTRVQAPVQTAYELRYQLMVTVFYSSTMPEGYSAFTD